MSQRGAPKGPLKALRAAGNGKVQEVDGIRMAILTSRLEGIARKMTNTLFRTARSQIIATVRDFSCCLVTAENELLAAAESLPIMVMSGPDLASRYMQTVHPNIRPGDAFLDNDPYHANSHAADFSLLIPIFDDDERHRFSAYIRAHLADCGNSLPATMIPTARDVYDEGALIFPMVQIQRDYKDIEDILRMVDVRIRVPELWRGDYNGMIGAGRIGEREVKALAAEVGWDTLDEHVRQWFDYSERLMIDAIRRLPSGRSSATSVHDAFGVFPEVPVTAVVEVDSEEARITVDFTDNPDCLPFGLNTTEATARTAAMAGTFRSVGGNIPPNGGSFRRLEVKLRDNCVIGIPKHPASCSMATTSVAGRGMIAVQLAFAQLADGFGLAGIGTNMTAGAPTVAGVDPRDGRPYIDLYVSGMTAGAGAPTVDAWLTATTAAAYGMIRRASVEPTELRVPMRVWFNEIEPDTEGAGKFRGAPSNRVVWGPANAQIQAAWFADGNINTAQGVRGGLPGGPSKQWILEPDGTLHPVDAFAHLMIEPEQRVVALSTGGGGYGSPFERDVALVEEDVREGWVSPERAASVYGVIFDAEGNVDHAATGQQRELQSSP